MARLHIFICTAATNAGRRRSLRKRCPVESPLACLADAALKLLRTSPRSWFRYKTDAALLPASLRDTVSISFVISRPADPEQLAALLQEAVRVIQMSGTCVGSFTGCGSRYHWRNCPNSRGGMMGIHLCGLGLRFAWGLALHMLRPSSEICERWCPEQLPVAAFARLPGCQPSSCNPVLCLLLAKLTWKEVALGAGAGLQSCCPGRLTGCGLCMLVLDQVGPFFHHYHVQPLTRPQLPPSYSPATPQFLPNQGHSLAHSLRKLHGLTASPP
ncbi:hypothetical protein V8C86DRAFT_736367 [Haematococcus lacustris]